MKNLFIPALLIAALPALAGPPLKCGRIAAPSLSAAPPTTLAPLSGTNPTWPLMPQGPALAANPSAVGSLAPEPATLPDAAPSAPSAADTPLLPALYYVYVQAGASISAAVRNARPGTTIHVAAGTYRENVTTAANGTPANHIQIVADGLVKIIGTGTEAMWSNSGSYVDIIGFDISGSGRLGILNNGSNTLIASNHVHNLAVSGGCTGNGGAGIDNANYNASNTRVIGNLVHDIGVPGGCNGVQGIYFSNPGGEISGNTVYGVSAWGIQLWHAATGVTIANNTVYQNGASGMGGGIVMGTGDAPGGRVLDNTRVINNSVYSNPANGITQYCDPGENCIGNNNTVANNLVYGNGRAITMKVGSATGTVTKPARCAGQHGAL